MKRLLVLAVAGMLLASACGSDDSDQGATTVATTNTTTTSTDQPISTRDPVTPTTSDPVLLTVGLRSFGSCDDILDFYIENALELVGPYGLGWGKLPDI